MLNNIDNKEYYINKFKEENNLNNNQKEQFELYYDFLKEKNQLFNITNITSLKSVINHHFQDSISLSKFLDLKNYKSLADIGSGGGFPGIPLKIINPNIDVKLIEVNNKKINFLNELIKKLSLSNIEVINLDWRTFLRKTEYNIDIFSARASLEMAELTRMFKTSCHYRNNLLVYWASSKWDLYQQYKELIKDEFQYNIANKKRKLILLKKN